MRCTCSITFFFFFFAFRVLAGKSGEEEKSEKKRCKGHVARHVSDMAASTRRYPSFRLNVHTHVQHFGGGVYIQWEKEEKIKAHSGVLLYTISWSAAQSDRGCTGVVVRDPFFGPRQVWQTFFLFFQGREPCSALQISRQKHVIVPNKRMSNNKPYRLSLNPHPPRKFLKRVRQKLCPSLFSLYPDKYWTVYTGRRFDRLRGSNLLTCGFVSL